MSADPPPTTTDVFKRGWQALVGLTGGDPARMREEVARWYDAAMDRAGSRYKRRTHIKLFFAGLAIALLFNINSIVIAKALRAGNAGDRARTIDAAKALLAAPAPAPTPSPTSTPGTGSASDPAPAPTPAAHTGATPPLLGTQTTTKEVPPTTSGTKKPATAATPVSPSAAALGKALEEAELPIGWGGAAWCGTLDLAVPDKNAFRECKVEPDPKEPKPAPPTPAGLALRWLLLLAGYFATAFAAMLGGPFWFDILGRFVNVRSALKPTAPGGK